MTDPAHEPPYPTSSSSNGRYVPMDLYLEDRKEMKSLLRDLTREVRGMRREMDRDDGAEVAQEAATVAVKETRKSKAERWWDVAKTVLAASLAVVGTLFAHSLIG